MPKEKKRKKKTNIHILTRQVLMTPIRISTSLRTTRPQFRRETGENRPFKGLDGSFIVPEFIPNRDEMRIEPDRGGDSEDVVMFYQSFSNGPFTWTT